MKTKITIFIFLSVLTSLTAQITTTGIKTKTEEPKSTVYDSLTNFVGTNVNLYVGQTFYLKGLAKELRQYGYDGFYNDYQETSVYKCCESDGRNSKYNALAGKYFNVLLIQKHPSQFDNSDLGSKKWMIQLQEKESNDKLYFEYDSEFDFSFPFIVVGFFEKTKKRVLNKEFIFSDIVLKSSLNIETSKEITTITGQKWKCVDLTIDEEFYTLSLVIQNDLGEKTFIGYESIYGEGAIKDLTFTVGQVNSYVKKFGKDKFNKILKGLVEIGMTKEMCLLAWGNPKKKNSTVTASGKTEQWVYNDNYLYFANGVVTVIK